MELGKKIRKIRKEKNISQKKLAEMAKMSNTFLCDIEVGRSKPSIDTLKNISIALEVDIKDFF